MALPDYAAGRSALPGQFPILLYYTTRTNSSSAGIFFLGILTLPTTQVCSALGDLLNAPDETHQIS